MILGGLEILLYTAAKPLIAKVGAKLAMDTGVAIAAHATPQILSHAAYGYATTTATTALAAPTAGAALGIVIDNLSDGGEFVEKVVKYREKHGKDGSSSSNSMDSTAVITIVTGILLDAYYRSLCHYDYNGEIKDSITKVDTCNTCSCTEYDDVKQSLASSNSSDHTCICGHMYGCHYKKNKIDWLVVCLAAEVYPLFKNRADDGSYKTVLSEIDQCNDCDCPDYDHSYENTFLSDRCRCGHKWRHHARNCNYAWVVPLFAVMMIINQND